MRLGAARRRIAHADRGFTLLELLLVVAIIAMATAGVSLALRDSAQSQLEMEAQRLAAVLDSARAQARATGVAVRWKTSNNGYTLDGKASAWQYPGIAAEAPPRGLVLGPEPLMARTSVRLWRIDKPESAVLVATDGLRPFSVEPANP
ncbi:MAG: prepilin-type N-terminal cleavage/methylation domain-containing protein [Rhodoferax sp.]|nr:prepilin-type N-terminal cleavage/methylation domain-containing protein [Rhodoferax sp.]